MIHRQRRYSVSFVERRYESHVAFILANGNLLPEKQRSNTASSMGERVCVLEPKSNRPIGFRINQFHSPPFTICQIEKDSSAEKAGLRVNDTLISINGKSVLQSNYEQIMQIINEAHHEQFIQIVVNQPTTRQKSLANKAQSSSLFNSDSDDIDSMDENVMINASSNHRRNVVEQYQSNYLQRENKISKHYRGLYAKALLSLFVTYFCTHTHVDLFSTCVDSFSHLLNILLY